MFKVLLIVHQAHSDPGRIGRLLVERGCVLDIRRTGLGDPLPATLEGYAGAVIFGGPMSANDDSEYDFIKAELDWISVPLKERKPFLGICLGAQLLARHLGAKVGPHEDGWHEIGYYKLRAAQARCPLFEPEQSFYQWHGEGFDLPTGATLLAAGDYFENQAFRHDLAYGLQFHPEVTRHMMMRWTAKSAHRMLLPGAQSRDSHLNGQARFDAGVDAWCERFIDHWLAPTTGVMAVAAE